jgi:Luciferase-like monooxygenase
MAAAGAILARSFPLSDGSRDARPDRASVPPHTDRQSEGFFMDYGHDLLFGTFITPAAQRPHHAVELAVVADRSGGDQIEAMGGPRRTPGEAVDALEEAISIIRKVWAAHKAGPVFFDGKHYRVSGAARGPAPAHAVEIWVGAGMPRMLRLVGRMADGWSVPIFVLGTDEAATIERFAAEVVPHTRELVAAERRAAAAA